MIPNLSPLRFWRGMRVGGRVPMLVTLLAIILVWVSIVTHLVQQRSQDEFNAYQKSGHLARFYDSLSIGNGTIVLVGLGDGVVRSYAPSGEAAVGTVLPPETMERLRGGPISGIYRAASSIDGVERFYSYRRLDKDGLAVVVGISVNEVSANFSRDAVLYAAMGVVLTVIIALLGAILIRQQRRLIESEALKSAILASSLDAIISIDRDSTIVEFNPSAERIFGHKVDDAIGRKINDLIIPTHLRQAHHDGMARYLATGAGPVLNTRIELDALHADGRIFPVEAAITATSFADRDVFIAYMRDISDRRAYEVDLKSARDAAEATSKAKSEFLSTMSHEIRIPLSGIVGMAGLLFDSPADARQLRFTETLRDAARDLQRIIDKILDFSKFEAGRLDFERLPFSVEQVIASVADLMGVKATEKHLALVVRNGAKIPDPLMGDPGRLRQVLMNLVSNGLKFTEAGSVTIATQLRGTKDQRVHLEFTVTDTGIGISDAAQMNLFRQFTQAESSISQRFGGTGLGLAICSRLVEQMGGSIDVVSAEGHGTTVRFDIYLGIATEAEIRPARVGAPLPAVTPTRTLRILLAEDNATNRLVAVTRLETIGHSVNAVASGQEAIDAVQSVAYDLVLMDVMMPEMNGIEATRAIRALSDPAAEVPIVALTANVFNEYRRACLAAGMDGFLAKPLMVADLLAILDRVMAGSLRVRGTGPLTADTGNLEATRARLAGEIGFEMVDLLLQTFATEAREGIVRLRAMVAARDWNGLRAGAATLRDAAATIGRQDVVDVAAVMILWSMGTSPNDTQFLALLLQLEAAIG